MGPAAASCSAPLGPAAVGLEILSEPAGSIIWNAFFCCAQHCLHTCAHGNSIYRSISLYKNSTFAACKTNLLKHFWLSGNFLKLELSWELGIQVTLGFNIKLWTMLTLKFVLNDKTYIIILLPKYYTIWFNIYCFPQYAYYSLMVCQTFKVFDCFLQW